MKLFPKLSKHDALGLSVISGGTPKILGEYDEQKSFEDNLLCILKSDSVFINYMPDLMEKYFRKPEIYHYILCAIANGNYRISGIGKFTGFEYNKCDNYVSALISAGIIKAEKEKSKNGKIRTAYVLTNSYFRLWYLYVYQNRTALIVGNGELTENIIKNILEKEIHAFHLQKAFAYVNEKMRDYWDTFRISEKIIYTPKIV